MNESHDSNPRSHVTQDDIVSPVQNISSILEQDVSDMEVTNLSTDVVHSYKNPSTNTVTSFLNVDKLNELATSINPTMSVIPPPPPPGVKQNVYFDIDDSGNRKRRLLRKHSEYPDDSGAWQQGKNSTKPHYYIKSDETTLCRVQWWLIRQEGQKECYSL